MQLFVLGCVVSLVVYLGQFLLLLQAVSSQGCREVSGEQLEFLGLVKKTPGLVKGDLGLGCGCLHERRRNCRLGSDLGQCSVPDFSPMTAVEVNARECDPSVSVSITFSALYYNFKMLLLPELLEKILTLAVLWLKVRLAALHLLPVSQSLLAKNSVGLG